VRRIPALVLLLSACGTSAPSRPPVSASAPVLVPPPAPPEDPARAAILLARARALRAEGDLAGALERLEAAHHASPASDDVKLELADLLVAEGRDADRAAALLDGGGVQQSARVHLLAARLAESRGDDLRAEAEYARALAEEDDTDARLRRALVLERLGRAAEATAELERARAERPGDALVRARLAERFEAAGRLAEAEAELRALAEEQPDRAAGWERLARFYERAGRPPDARAALARARDAGGRSGRVLRPLLPSKR